MASTTKKTTKKKTTSQKAADKERKSVLFAAFLYFFLGLYSALGYFSENGVVIALLRKVFTGLFGYGFFLLPIAFIYIAYLVFSLQSKPFSFRIFSILFTAVLIGSICHLLLTDAEYALNAPGLLWADGIVLKCGGIISGSLTIIFAHLLSKIGAGILLFILLIISLIFVFNISVFDELSKWKSQRDAAAPDRAQYKEEKAANREVARAERSEARAIALEYQKEKRQLEKDRKMEEQAEKLAAVKAERAKLQEQARIKRAIDLPLDSEEPTKAKRNADGGFYNSTPNVITPDAYVNGVAEEKDAEPTVEKKTYVPISFIHKPKATDYSVPIAPVTDVNEVSEPTAEAEEEIEYIREEPFYEENERPSWNDEDEVGKPEEDYFEPSETERQIDEVLTAFSQNPEVTEISENSPLFDDVEDTDVIYEDIDLPEPLDEQADDAQSVDLISEETVSKEPKHEYVFPPLDLLSKGSVGNGSDVTDEITFNRLRLEKALHSFGINSPITNVIHGPSVTRYETELEAGVKLNKITNLADDIALALGASGVRIAAIPNKISTVGIEVPNKSVSSVYLREIIDSDAFRNSSSRLTFALGKNISGEAIVGNISKLPHILVAGTTGSGKSVALNSLILSILYKATPAEVQFIMIDPKMVEFKIYNSIPHMMVPVVTEAKKAAGALQWAVNEMMKRYRLFSDAGARDLPSYNAIAAKADDPQMPVKENVVVVIDELADLMLVAAKEVEDSICRIAQMGRAAGIHLVIATQSPRADVITGLMKANIPSRIALKVSSSLESRIILDAGGGADKLIGNGDMLYAPVGTTKPLRIQGTWVSDEEREAIVNFLKSNGTPSYNEEVIAQINQNSAEKESAGSSNKQAEQSEPEDDKDEMFDKAVELVIESGQASVSMLQRRLKLGYARAARLVDQMEDRGVVGPFEGAKPRQVLITKQQYQEMQFINGTAPINSQNDSFSE